MDMNTGQGYLLVVEDIPDIPVIFLTATYVAPEDKAFALTIGVSRFIEKPVDFDQFLPTVAEIMAKGAPAPLETLNELDFYEGYRKRLEEKLNRSEEHTSALQAPAY